MIYILQGCAPTACGKSLRYGLRSQTPQPDVSDDKGRSTASVCSPFSGQMTTFRPVPACRLALQEVTSPLLRGRFHLFFEPGSQGEAAHAKDTFNSAHAGALIVIRNNLFLLFFGIAWPQLQNSPFTTILAPILLLTLSVVPIFDDVGATATAAFVSDRFFYHAAESITSLGFLPLPTIELELKARVRAQVTIVTGKLNQRHVSASMSGIELILA